MPSCADSSSKLVAEAIVDGLWSELLLRQRVQDLRPDLQGRFQRMQGSARLFPRRPSTVHNRFRARAQPRQLAAHFFQHAAEDASNVDIRVACLIPAHYSQKCHPQTKPEPCDLANSDSLLGWSGAHACSFAKDGLQPDELGWPEVAWTHGRTDGRTGHARPCSHTSYHR